MEYVSLFWPKPTSWPRVFDVAHCWRRSHRKIWTFWTFWA